MQHTLFRSFRIYSLALVLGVGAFTLSAAQAAQLGAPTLDRSLTGVQGADRGRDKRDGTATYVVRLRDAAVAEYGGGVAGLRATSPARTGADKLDVRSADSRAYKAHLAARHDAVLADLRRVAGSDLKPIYQYFYALNGMAVRLSPQQAAAARSLKGVASVTRDIAYELDTDRGPTLIGAPAVWDGSASGFAAQGEGMVVGIMDSGINQGHPSFAEVGDDGYGASGEYAATNPFGAGNFAGGARDDCSNVAFQPLCNNKLIGSHVFLDAYGGVDQYAPVGDPQSKDTDGHGSHVASTSAGNRIIDPPLLDADGNASGLTLGTVSGVAPHAHVIAYKVCAPSCFASDIAGAIDQAIIDGADALNHSIGAAGGSPWNDFKSLAFKGARAAGIMLQNSAGNSGPDAGTAARINASPWSTAVGASTHDRTFPAKTLEQMSGGDTPAPGTIDGRAVTEGFTGEIVYAGDFPVGSPGDDNFDQPEQCLDAFPAGTFTANQIVVCDRGAIARVQKARNVRDGGAGALVLANTQGGATSTNDDLHVIPAIHINANDGDVLRAWLASGTGHMATITDSGPAFSDPGSADILAGFSSRGPYTNFDWLAPHVAAPGSAIFAAGSDLQFVHQGTGNDAPSVAAAWGIISGTSMASPHATGAATLLKQLRPDWTAAEVRSALMTTGVPDMRKEDGVTPADPFDYGGGRVDVAAAAAAGLVLDETIANMDAADPVLGGDPATLNLPDVVSNTCVLNCSWQRTVKNTSGGTQSWTVTTETRSGMTLAVNPSSFTLADGATQTLDISADTTLGDAGWNFGLVNLLPGVPEGGGASLSDQHLTVAAFFATATNPALFNKSADRAVASVGETIGYALEVNNVAETDPFAVDDALPGNVLFVAGSETVTLTGGATTTPLAYNAGTNTLSWGGTLDTGGIDVVSDPFPPAGSPFGYVSLPGIGVPPEDCSNVCDDTFIELNGLPPFTYAGSTYTDMVIGSNGFIVPGTDTDSAFTNANQNMPDATAPNTVIAPFWTDLDLDGTSPTDTGAGFIYAGAFNGGAFIIVEFNGVEVWNQPGPKYTFQIQIGTDLAPPSFQGVWFVYNEIGAIPASLSVGAEAPNALFGDTYYYNGTGTLPITGDLGDLRVDSVSGGSALITFDAIVDGVVGDVVLNTAASSNTGGSETAIAITEIAFEDADGDGVEDFADNCLLTPNPSQCDSDADNFGNDCDADFNDSGFVNFGDLGALKVGFMGPSSPPDYSELDLNCDGAIDFVDLGLFKGLFGAAPGPTGID